ncbi:putative solute carrier organic anion transporter family member 1A4 [Apostichopus japonicus]|uniref:Putative solute carrier organic anion transporter family member 1A4 n=1 Tax=Stichopus japonicus TaxID=307972 RepID=A0A2G8JCA8_STIJA|nr:putative solute carrier organic anion transporter family member 1A4 [Apostichopus japonicus]
MSDETGILLCRVFPRLGSPVVFAILLFTALFISTAPAGYVGGVASTLERRFQLKSSELAFLNVVFDISSLVVLLFVTHYGHNRHRGRVLGAVFALAGVGALCNAVPHFIYPVPDALKDATAGQSNNETIHLCGDKKVCDDNSKGLGGQTWWIALGSVFASFSSTVFPVSNALYR